MKKMEVPQQCRGTSTLKSQLYNLPPRAAPVQVRSVFGVCLIFPSPFQEALEILSPGPFNVLVGDGIRQRGTQRNAEKDEQGFHAGLESRKQFLHAGMADIDNGKRNRYSSTPGIRGIMAGMVTTNTGAWKKRDAVK